MQATKACPRRARWIARQEDAGPATRHCTAFGRPYDLRRPLDCRRDVSTPPHACPAPTQEPAAIVLPHAAVGLRYAFLVAGAGPGRAHNTIAGPRISTRCSRARAGREKVAAGRPPSCRGKTVCARAYSRRRRRPTVRAGHLRASMCFACRSTPTCDSSPPHPCSAPTGRGAFDRLRRRGTNACILDKRGLRPAATRPGARGRQPASAVGTALDGCAPAIGGARPAEAGLQTRCGLTAAAHRADSCPTSAPSRPGSIRSRRRACGLPGTADSHPPVPGCR